MDSEVLEFHDCTDIEPAAWDTACSQNSAMTSASAHVNVQAEVHAPPRSLDEGGSFALAGLGESAGVVSLGGSGEPSGTQSLGGLREPPEAVALGDLGEPSDVIPVVGGELAGEVSSVGTHSSAAGKDTLQPKGAKEHKAPSKGSSDLGSSGLRSQNVKLAGVRSSSKTDTKKVSGIPSVRGRSKLNR